MSYKHASDEQLKHISPVRKLLLERWDAELSVDAEHNRRALTTVDSDRLACVYRSDAPLAKSLIERLAHK